MDITINNLERNTTDDAVIIAHWNAVLIDGDHHASAYGSQSFTRNDESPALVPFADLTEADVVAWLDLDEGLEAGLQAQIDEQKAPSTVSGKPWDVLLEEVA
jgi:hypothetical protein